MKMYVCNIHNNFHYEHHYKRNNFIRLSQYSSRTNSIFSMIIQAEQMEDEYETFDDVLQNFEAKWTEEMAEEMAEKIDLKTRKSGKLLATEFHELRAALEGVLRAKSFLLSAFDDEESDLANHLKTERQQQQKIEKAIQKATHFSADMSNLIMQFDVRTKSLQWHKDNFIWQHAVAIVSLLYELNEMKFALLSAGIFFSVHNRHDIIGEIEFRAALHAQYFRKVCEFRGTTTINYLEHGRRTIFLRWDDTTHFSIYGAVFLNQVELLYMRNGIVCYNMFNTDMPSCGHHSSFRCLHMDKWSPVQGGSFK